MRLSLVDAALGESRLHPRRTHAHLHPCRVLVAMCTELPRRVRRRLACLAADQRKRRPQLISRKNKSGRKTEFEVRGALAAVAHRSMCPRLHVAGLLGVACAPAMHLTQGPAPHQTCKPTFSGCRSTLREAINQQTAKNGAPNSKSHPKPSRCPAATRPLAATAYAFLCAHRHSMKSSPS